MIKYAFLILLGIINIAHAQRDTTFTLLFLISVKIPDDAVYSGYSGESCTDDSDCFSTRECVDYGDILRLPKCGVSSEKCFCMYPLGDRVCTTSDDCEVGDRCLSASIVANNGCMSCRISELLNAESAFQKVDRNPVSCTSLMDGENDPPLSISPPQEITSPLPSVSRQVIIVPSTIPFLSSPEPVMPSTEDEDEEDPLESTSIPLSISPSAFPSSFLMTPSRSPQPPSPQTVQPTVQSGTPDPPPSEVCIAVSSLRNVHPSKLVFKQHIKAAVLCDSNDNCATPGHIVEFRGRPMMMKSYCRQIGVCTKRVKFVNSIRMEAGARLASNIDHMHFTAFAARYETNIEEVILRQLLRTIF